MAEKTYHHGNLREALLERAVLVLEEEGVEGLSLRGLARDLGVSHAAPARHFSGKADLLAVIASEGYRRMTAATLEAAGKAETALDKLRAMGRASVRWARDNRAFYSAIMNPEVNRYSGDELTTSLSNYLRVVSEAFDAAQKAGWKTGNRPLVLMLFGVATTIGASVIFSDYLQGHLFGDIEDDSLIEELIDLVLPSQ